MDRKPYDVTIVGGGPVGLFGATLSALHGLDTILVESLDQWGGQMAALYPAKAVYDVPGFAASPAQDVVDALVAQMERHGPAVRLGETVTHIDQPTGVPSEPFRVTTSRGTFCSAALLITAGLGAFAPRRLSALHADRLEGRGVTYIPPSGEHFRDQTVVVVGGGDTAVDWALDIAPHARAVIMVHRRSQFRAQAEGLRQLAALPQVEWFAPYELVEVLGEEAVTGVRLRSFESGVERVRLADAVIGGLGFQPRLGPIQEWDLELAGSTLVVDRSTMATGRPGVYAAGDIAHYPGKVRLVAVGFGEIAVAVEQIRRWVHPHLTGTLPHSTTLARSTRSG